MTCRTNIVLLTDCLGDITGGAEKQIFELAKRLPKDQYNVFVASMESRGETSKALLESIGCRLEVFRIVRIYGLSGFIQGLKFFSFLRKNSVNVLITYHFGSDIWGTFWGHLAGVRSIISNRRDMGFWRNQSHVNAYRLINRWVNKIVTVTSCVKQMVAETEDVPDDKLEIIYNGVDVPQGPFNNLQKKAELGLHPSNIIVMHVANLRPVKGHKYLIEAFAAAARRFSDIKLVLIGKDELNGELQDLAQNLGIKEKVLFLGQRTDVAELLSVSDICVLPSLSEGMSNAILEYMALGKPVIATNVGGNPELIQNGYNGLLVDKENIGQLAESLIELLGDEKKRQTFGANGLALIKEKFSMEAMMARYDKLFKETGAIKVLHLVSSGGLFGAEQVILTLAACTDETVHIVGALDNQHNPHLEIIEEGKKRGLNTAVFESKGRLDFSTIGQVRKFVLNNKIDIIHTHNYKANLIGAWAARNSRKKWVATIHGWIGTDAKLRSYESVDAFILKFAQKVICVSESNYQNLLQRGFSPERLAVIFNGIALNRFARGPDNLPLKQDLGINNATVIAIIGRLAPEKGHKVLFEAMAQIIKQHPDTKLLVIGDGPLRNTLENQIKELNLSDHIILTGIREDMPDIYRICDILVNASFTEGLPMTILEAMACKVAVIATSVGAVPQIIQDDKSGILLKPNDPGALAGALSQLIGDPQKRQQLAQEAYANVTTSFSDRTMFNKYKEIYKILLK